MHCPMLYSIPSSFPWRVAPAPVPSQMPNAQRSISCSCFLPARITSTCTSSWRMFMVLVSEVLLVPAHTRLEILVPSLWYPSKLSRYLLDQKSPPFTLLPSVLLTDRMSNTSSPSQERRTWVTSEKSAPLKVMERVPVLPAGSVTWPELLSNWRSPPGTR